jgi:hypothetical protein
MNSFNLTLKKSLEQSPLFKDIPISIEKRNDLNNLNYNEQKNNLVLTYKFRMIIDTSCIKSYNSSFYENDLGDYFLYSLFHIELSDFVTKEVYDSYKLSDTMVWPKQNSYEHGMPTEAIIEAGKATAEKYACRIAPHWTTEERIIYYRNNRKIRNGYECFVQNDLEGAIKAWDKLYTIGTRPLAATAAYNIALVYEIQDNLDSCESWLTKSIKLKRYKQSQRYLERIMDRKLERMKLNNQIQGFKQ